MPLIYAELESPLTFTRFQALPGDATKPGYYPGVLVIEKGPAKGHFAVKDGSHIVNYDPSNEAHTKLHRFQIVIGDVTLDDVVTCGIEDGNSKCKLDHGTTVRTIVGDYAKFRREGDQVRADLTLDSDLDGYKHTVALIKTFSKKIGNSIDFDYFYEIDGDVAIARCRKLNSVDIVDAPAATKSLFNQTPNNPPPHMPLDKADLDAIGNLIDTKLSEQKTEFSTQLGELSKRFEEGDDKDKDKDKDKEKKKKDDNDDDDTAKMSEIASKAALAAVEAAFPKAQREQFAKLSEPHAGKSKFEQLVDAQIQVGAPNKGIAMQRVARDYPVEYNAHMSAINGPAKGTL